jgi:hypothetical protein
MTATMDRAFSWSAEDLARESAPGVNTIRRAEVAEEGISFTAANELAIRRALEAASTRTVAAPASAYQRWPSALPR